MILTGLSVLLPFNFSLLATEVVFSIYYLLVKLSSQSILVLPNLSGA